MFKNVTEYLLIVSMLQITTAINSGAGFSRSAETTKANKPARPTTPADKKPMRVYRVAPIDARKTSTAEFIPVERRNRRIIKKAERFTYIPVILTATTIAALDLRADMADHMGPLASESLPDDVVCVTKKKLTSPNVIKFSDQARLAKDASLPLLFLLSSPLDATASVEKLLDIANDSAHATAHSPEKLELDSSNTLAATDVLA